MARTKQANPVQRTPSSEYVTRQNGAAANSVNFHSTVEPAPSNGAALAGKTAIAPREIEKKEAGILQLVIAVAGIYGSLYVPSSSSSVILHTSL
jgi:solute carrier family 35 (UDP-galactose transporter), member B1